MLRPAGLRPAMRPQAACAAGDFFGGVFDSAAELSNTPPKALCWEILSPALIPRPLFAGQFLYSGGEHLGVEDKLFGRYAFFFIMGGGNFAFGSYAEGYARFKRARICAPSYGQAFAFPSEIFLIYSFQGLYKLVFFRSMMRKPEHARV